MKLILLGPPGAGKGTQAAEIASTYRVVHISTGEILRAAYRDGDQLGIEAHRLTERGELVTDDIVIALVERKLGSLGAKGWLLDGFPRTLEQAAALDRYLESRGQGLDRVLLIQVDAEEIVGRLKDRRVCQDCGSTYHLRFRPPGIPGQCDRCGGELHQRSDDRPGTIRKRLEVYEAETQPLIEYYEKRNLLAHVDGNQDIDRVVDAIKAVLNTVRSSG